MIVTKSQRIKVATFASVSFLRDQGRLRVKDASHHELEYDATTNTYSDVKMPTIGELYTALEKAIAIIEHSVANLALVLMDADIALKAFEREIKRDVAVFSDPKSKKDSTRSRWKGSE
jgi:hypothetical protein